MVYPSAPTMGVPSDKVQEKSQIEGAYSLVGAQKGNFTLLYEGDINDLNSDQIVRQTLLYKYHFYVISKCLRMTYFTCATLRLSSMVSLVIRFRGFTFCGLVNISNL